MPSAATVHTRFARGFVTNTVRSGDERTVTFANGFVARERLVSMDDDLRRLAYTLMEGPIGLGRDPADTGDRGGLG